MEKKLLIIEDSKPIATIHWHIAKRIGLPATIAYSFAQTQQIINSGEQFFCAVIDYNLPDACHGEAIDYVVKAGIPAIVMTGMTNNDVRQAILKRPIIDYIPKGNKQAYQYLQQLLSQLIRNEHIKVLVVDDSITSRNFVSSHLHRHRYQVYEACDGLEALEVLDVHPDIKLVITDQQMPRMDGIALTDKIRQRFSKEELVIIGISGLSDNSLTARFIKSGANDYLHKPFCTEEFNCRLMHNIQYIENIETIRDQANKVERRNRDIAVLSEIGREITGTLDLEQILSKVYRHVNALMDVHVFSIGLYRAESALIEFQAAIVGGEELEQYTLPMDNLYSLAVWCVAHQKEVVLHQRDDHLNYVGQIYRSKSGVDTQSIIYQPLLAQDHLIGCLSVQSMQEDAYSDYQLDMVRTIASYTAIALDNAESHRKLKDSQTQLVMQEKMASLGTLTAGVAHEINNPTNFAHVSAQNLEVDLKRFETFLYSLLGDEADQSIIDSFSKKFEPLFKHLSTITDGTERIKGIVKDLQAFTRQDGGGQKEVRIVDCLKSTIKLVQAKYRESAKFVVDFSLDPTLMCWPAQLNQVFMNLLVNACQAILQRQQHDQSLSGMVNIATYGEEGYVVISISDNGCGMDATVQSKLFEPFFTTKDVGAGTGLGLSISFGIIQKHQGDIRVESAPGEGTVFSIRLPC
ncbi:MAG: signal transduction histidine kinase/DNA-binding response OmpR family regulator [Phenylobacterium sp.]